MRRLGFRAQVSGNGAPPQYIRTTGELSKILGQYLSGEWPQCLYISYFCFMKKEGGLVHHGLMHKSSSELVTQSLVQTSFYGQEVTTGGRPFLEQLSGRVGTVFLQQCLSHNLTFSSHPSPIAILPQALHFIWPVSTPLLLLSPAMSSELSYLVYLSQGLCGKQNRIAESRQIWGK